MASQELGHRAFISVRVLAPINSSWIIDTLTPGPSEASA